MILSLYNICANNFDKSNVKISVFFFMTGFLEKDLDKEIFVIFCVCRVCVKLRNLRFQRIKVVRSNFVKL